MANFFFKVVATGAFASYIGFGIVACTKSDIAEQKNFAGASVFAGAVACAACIGAGLSPSTKRRRFQ